MEVSIYEHTRSIVCIEASCVLWPLTDGGRQKQRSQRSLPYRSPAALSLRYNGPISKTQHFFIWSSKVKIIESLWFCLQKKLGSNFKYDYHSVTLSHYKTDEPKLGLLRKLWKEPWYHSPSPLTMFVVDSFRWIMKELINTDYSGAKWSAAPYGCNKYEIITTSSRPWLSIR